MKNNHYPIQFQAQYQQTAQKILSITKKYQAKILNQEPSAQQNLESYLEMIQDDISDKDLVFRKQSIYSQFASGQQMAENRKTPPEMCPECGEEIKKVVQCEFCAEIFCIKCCSRKRVIPFVSKDFRLCCQQCHWKFVKLIQNKNFYEQKQTLTNAINNLRTKTAKVKQKLQMKRGQFQKVKNQRRSQKIKQKNLQGKVLAEEKKMKALQQEYRRVIGEKAEKIKEEERRKRVQEQQREKAKKAEEERFLVEEQEKREQQKRRVQSERRKKGEQNVYTKQQQKNKLPERASLKKAQLKPQQQIPYSDSLRKKQDQLKRRQQQLLLRQSLIKRKLQEQYEQKQSNKSNLSSNKITTPKQSTDHSEDKGQFHLQTNDTVSQKRSRKQSQDIKNQKQSNKSSDLNHLQKIVRVESTQSAKEQHKKSLGPVKTQQPKEKEEFKQQEEEVVVDSLEKSLANMLKSNKNQQSKSIRRDDDSKSMYSTKSKSILDMNVNDMLSIRIPSVPNSLKANFSEQQRADRFSSQVLNNEQSHSPKRLSRKVTVQQPKVQQTASQAVVDRQAIIRNASLISSYKETVVEPENTPNKCACQIM